MKLSEKIQNDMKEAMRAKDELKVSTLRLLVGAIQNFAIEKESTSYEPSDEDVIGVIQKQVKQRKDSIESYKSGGRVELAQKETKELKILQSYLPAMMGDEEVEKLVESAIKETGASSPSEIGQVMGKLIALKGKADMGKVSSIVKQKLSKG